MKNVSSENFNLLTCAEVLFFSYFVWKGKYMKNMYKKIEQKQSDKHLRKC